MIGRYVVLAILLVYEPIGLLGEGMRDPREPWLWLTLVGAVVMALVVRVEWRRDLRQLCIFWVAVGMFELVGLAMAAMVSIAHGQWLTASLALALVAGASWLAAFGYLVTTLLARDGEKDLLGSRFGRAVEEHRGVRFVQPELPERVSAGEWFQVAIPVQNGWLAPHRVRFELRRLSLGNLVEIPGTLDAVRWVAGRVRGDSSRRKQLQPLVLTYDPDLVQSIESIELAGGQAGWLVIELVANRAGRFPVHVVPVVEGPGGKRLLRRAVRQYQAPTPTWFRLVAALAGADRGAAGMRHDLNVHPSSGASAPAASRPPARTSLEPLDD